MTNLQVLDHIVAEPFRPFRIRTSGGRTFDVRNPEAAGVGLTTVVLSVPLSGDIPDAKGAWYSIPLTSVETIEPLESPLTSGQRPSSSTPS